MSHPEPLDRIEQLTKRRAEAQESIHALARQARGEGATWPQLATALGISPQAAQQRYGTTSHKQDQQRGKGPVGTTITTNHGTYGGRSVETIVRRIYGRKAEFRGSSDPSSAEAGMIVRWDKDASGYHVLGTVRRIEHAEQEQDG